MELYIPSFTAAIIAAFIIIYVFPNFTPVVLAFFAGAALVYGIYYHYIMFGSEYSSMTLVDGIRKSASFVMVSTLIVFLMGYLLYLYRSKSAPAPAAARPSNSYTPPPPPRNNAYARSRNLNMDFEERTSL